jgi:hypothetical protein
MLDTLERIPYDQRLLVSPATLQGFKSECPLSFVSSANFVSVVPFLVFDASSIVWAVNIGLVFAMRSGLRIFSAYSYAAVCAD